VVSTSTQVAAERGLDLRHGRTRVALQDRGRRHYLPRPAPVALSSVLRYPRLLQRVDYRVSLGDLRGQDGVPDHPERHDVTRLVGNSVDEDGARAAGSPVTRLLRSDEAEVVPKDVDQHRPRSDVHV